MVANMKLHYDLISGLPVELATSHHRSVQAAFYVALRGEPPLAAIVLVLQRRLLRLELDDIPPLAVGGDGRERGHYAAAHRVVALLPAAATLLHAAGLQGWVRALFGAWNTTARFSGRVRRCPFCCRSSRDRLSHLYSCSALQFMGQQIFPALWLAGYTMTSIESFLGIGADSPMSPFFACLVAAWLDAVHFTVMASKKGTSSGDAARSLGARARVFITKFSKTARANSILCEGIRPNASYLHDWT